MATSRKQSADDQNQDASADATQQQQNHAQTPDQAAANKGAFAQSSYQTTQKAGASAADGGSGPQPTEAGESEGSADNLLGTAVQAGKKWLDESGVLTKANELPQAAREWGSKALTSVNALSTTQKVVGGALLLAGAAYLTTRGGKSKSSSKSEGYRQGSWAGYAGGKSAAGRGSAAGGRPEVSSYGTERRASSSYGRGASSSDTDFGSGRGASSYGTQGAQGAQPGSRPSASTGSRGGEGSPSQNQSRQGSGYQNSGSQGSGGYLSGSSYNAGRSSGSSSASSPSPMGKSGSSASSRNSPNSNEEDYETSF